MIGCRLVEIYLFLYCRESNTFKLGDFYSVENILARLSNKKNELSSSMENIEGLQNVLKLYKLHCYKFRVKLKKKKNQLHTPHKFIKI